MITLEQVWTDYRSIRKLKETTFYDYEQKLKRCLGDWLPLDATTITRQMVEDRHRELSVTAPRQANYVMRVLRALLTFAAYKYDDTDGSPLFKNNPVKTLSAMRLWNREIARNGYIPKHKMADWFSAVLLLPNTTMRDFLLTLALTGFRNAEARTLRWSCIDLERGLIKLDDTKNHLPHVLPMSDFLWSMMLERPKSSDFVFPGPGKKGHLIHPYDATRRIGANIDHYFIPHDLRRTFNYVSEQAQIDETTRKRMLNHKPQDVTNKHYGVFDVEDLRAPMQAVTDKYRELANLQKS